MWSLGSRGKENALGKGTGAERSEADGAEEALRMPVMSFGGLQDRRCGRFEVRRDEIQVALGAALFFAWGFLTFLSPSVVGPQAPQAVHIEYAFMASQAAVVASSSVLVALARLRRPAIPAAWVVLAGLVMSIGTAGAAILCDNLGIDRSLMLLVGLAVGTVAPLLGIAWGSRMMLTARRGFLIVLASFALAYALYFTVSGLAAISYPLACTLTCFMPTASVALWGCDRRRRALRSGTGELRCELACELAAGETSLALLGRRDMLLLALLAFVGNFVPGVVLEYRWDAALGLSMTAFMLVSVLCLHIMLRYSRMVGMVGVGWVYRTVIPVMAAGAVAVVLWPNGSALGVAGGMMMSGGLFLQACAYLFMVERTHAQGMSPAVSFAVAQLIIALPVLAGNMAGKLMLSVSPVQGDRMLTVFCALSLMVLTCALVGLFDGRGKRSLQAEGGDALRREVVANGASTGASRLAARAGLTPREAEVLALLARGRSVPYIAESLFITAGTVKTHVRHIYEKAGVATRQQLIDALEDDAQG
ncbi:helix-turn-helix transcriptional regulator [Eggerthellaceae bacterium zg-1084]|uniref:response regulator transcription factor n=1 Tax=Berryella wangjianweii TaxID=2734634 RepID=UPI0015532B0E|nr:LuxR C-terminal-related transcriptional regulator [Berryella wangjianweii]NPD30867.1 helix-turn-helix transcriptional regulator [Berryella wangjianweii]